MARSVHQPRIDLTVLTTHKSVRSSWPPKLIVLHDTEYHDYPGVRDLNDLGQWFRKARLSSHIGIDGDGNTARYVYDHDKAWHASDFNSVSLGIEQIGFASFTEAMWNRNHRAQMRKTAKWIAWWSHEYGIPIRKGEVKGRYVTIPGVVTHKMLGAYGGGHVDPGTNYPFRSVLTSALYYRKYGWT